MGSILGTLRARATYDIAFRAAVIGLLVYIAAQLHDIANTPAIDWQESAAIQQMAEDVATIKSVVDR